MKSITIKEVIILELEGGVSPFLEWFNSLKDKRLEIAVDARLARIREGNFGDHKSLGGDIYELRIHYGSGSRIYYGIDGNTLIVILHAGSKKTQQKDILKAKKLWARYLDEKN